MSWGTIHGQQGGQTPKISYRGVAGDYTQGGIPAVTPLPPGPAQPTPMGFGNIDQSQLDALISETEQTVSSAAAESSVAAQTQEKVPFFQRLQQAFAPGTPGAEFASQGLEAVQGYVQGARNDLASLQGRLARKQAALRTASQPAKRARLQQEIALLQQQIAQLTGAMQTNLAPMPKKPKTAGIVLGGLGDRYRSRGSRLPALREEVMIGSVTALHGPHVYGGYGISGAGSIVRAEKKLRNAKSKCTKWEEEYARREGRDDEQKGLFAWIGNQTRKLTKPTTGAKRKMDKWCSMVTAAEEELAALRRDEQFRVATDPASQLAAASQASAAQTQQLLAATGEGPSPFKILGIGGLVLGIAGAAIYFLFR